VATWAAVILIAPSTFWPGYPKVYVSSSLEHTKCACEEGNYCHLFRTSKRMCGVDDILTIHMCVHGRCGGSDVPGWLASTPVIALLPQGRPRQHSLPLIVSQAAQRRAPHTLHGLLPLPGLGWKDWKDVTQARERTALTPAQSW
jgi:hypothetical protein